MNRYKLAQIVPISDDHETKELESELNKLRGKKIIDIGFIKECPEGGLTIDYIEAQKKNRIVIGFNELGAWLTWKGEIE